VIHERAGVIGLQHETSGVAELSAVAQRRLFLKLLRDKLAKTSARPRIVPSDKIGGRAEQRPAAPAIVLDPNAVFIPSGSNRRLRAN
jgi:hypothetical protein